MRATTASRSAISGASRSNGATMATPRTLPSAALSVRNAPLCAATTHRATSPSWSPSVDATRASTASRSGERAASMTYCWPGGGENASRITGFWTRCNRSAVDSQPGDRAASSNAAAPAIWRMRRARRGSRSSTLAAMTSCTTRSSSRPTGLVDTKASSRNVCQTSRRRREASCRRTARSTSGASPGATVRPPAPRRAARRAARPGTRRRAPRRPPAAGRRAAPGRAASGDRVRGEVEGEGVAAAEAQHLLGGVTTPDALLHERGRVVDGHRPDLDLVRQLPPFPGTPRGVGRCAGDDDGGRRGRQRRHEVVADPVVDQPQTFVPVDDEQRDVAVAAWRRPVRRRSRRRDRPPRSTSRGTTPAWARRVVRRGGWRGRPVAATTASTSTLLPIPGAPQTNTTAGPPGASRDLETPTLTLTPDAELHPCQRQPVHDPHAAGHRRARMKHIADDLEQFADVPAIGSTT